MIIHTLVIQIHTDMGTKFLSHSPGANLIESQRRGEF
jgi:hypothetical protein